MWLFCAPLTNKKESSIKLELFVPVSKVPFIISRTKKANRHGLKKSQQEGIIEVGIQTLFVVLSGRKTEALFRFIVRHYSQPSDKLLCILGTYTLHHTASELARQYFKSLKTLQHPLLLWYFPHFETTPTAGEE